MDPVRPSNMYVVKDGRACTTKHKQMLRNVITLRNAGRPPELHWPGWWHKCCEIREWACRAFGAFRACRAQPTTYIVESNRERIHYCQQLISASHSISHYSREHMARGMMWIFFLWPNSLYLWIPSARTLPLKLWATQKSKCLGIIWKLSHIVWGSYVWVPMSHVWGSHIWASHVWASHIWGSNVWGSHVCTDAVTSWWHGMKLRSSCGCCEPMSRGSKVTTFLGEGYRCSSVKQPCFSSYV